MRGSLVVAVVAAMSAGALVACASLSGADALFVGEGDESDAVVESSAPMSDGGGLPNEHDDADAPLPPCEAGVCVPIGDGWTTVLRENGDFGAPSNCPESWPELTVYDSPEMLVCGCKCTRNGGSCEGALELTQGGGFLCNGTPQAMPSLPGDGGCTAASLTGISVGTPMKLSVTAANPPPSCSGTPTQLGGGLRAMRVCGGVTPLTDAQCSGGAVCVPRPTDRRDRICLIHDGSLPCPNSFSDRREIGIDGVDGRGCSACACDVDCNADGTVEGFINAGCSGSLGKVTLGQCGGSSLPNGTSFRYVAGSGCKIKTSSTVTGDVSYPQVKTLCCSRAEN
jgi:hypothetical protein